MARPIQWAEGNEDDTAELRGFVCSPDPPPIQKVKHRKYAGAFWEREVQTGIRAITAPVPPDELLVVGRDGDGIVAVSHSYQVRRDPMEFKVLGVAVALRARGWEPRVGPELLDETLMRLINRADAANEDFLEVWGLIHTRNAASQFLMEEHDFHYVTEDDAGYQQWAMTPIDLRA